MKVAIIHYWFITRRGGEKVIESILKLFPEADIYTLFYDKKVYGDYLQGHRVFPSILNTSIFRDRHQKVFPLYPLGIKSIKLKEKYDLIISSESGPAKGVRIPNSAFHICYVHSPMRYVWSHTEDYVQSANFFVRPLLRFLFKKLRKWDKTTIANVDLYLANSTNVAKRIKRFYHKEAIVVYPPIESNLFRSKLKQNDKLFYLSFGAITPYKRIDLLVEAFNKNGERLVIIGEGSERQKLEKKAKSNIAFKTCKEWSEVEEVISKSKALLFPGEEDFGMIPLEVMAYGIPVIAFKKGGALETVVENRNCISKSTGVFFEEQSVEDLNKALSFFESHADKFDPVFIRNHAKNFQESTFLNKFEAIINDKVTKATYEAKK